MISKTKLKHILPFIFVLLVILLAKWLVSSRDIEHAQQVLEKSWPVQVDMIKKTDASPEVILYGQVESPKQATLSSTIESDVIDVFVKEGDIVKKNKQLVKLDTEEYTLIVQQRKAAIDEMKAQIQTEITEFQNDLKSQKHLERLVSTNEVMMKRLETLQSKRLEAQSNVDEALNKLLLQQINLVQKQLEVANHKNILAQLQAKLAQLEASYSQAMLDVDDANIVAPFDGRITEVFVAPGDIIIPGTKLVDLYDLNDVEIRAQLPQKYLAAINQAFINKKQLLAKIPSPVNIQLKALRTGAALKTGSSTIDLFFKVPLENAVNLPLNQTVQLFLKLPTIKEVYIVPATSVYGESRIYMVKNDRLKSFNIEILGEKYINGQLFYLVRQNNLPDSFTILVSKIPNARDGLKVNAR